MSFKRILFALVVALIGKMFTVRFFMLLGEEPYSALMYTLVVWGFCAFVYFARGLNNYLDREVRGYHPQEDLVEKVHAWLPLEGHLRISAHFIAYFLTEQSRNRVINKGFPKYDRSHLPRTAIVPTRANVIAKMKERQAELYAKDMEHNVRTHHLVAEMEGMIWLLDDDEAKRHVIGLRVRNQLEWALIYISRRYHLDN